MKFLAALAAVAAIGTLAACGDTTPKRPTADQDVAAIMEFNKHYLGAINDGDIKTLSALTTEGHVMIAPNRPPIVGKAANDAMNGGAFERYEFSETWRPVETVIDGDLGFQRGTFTVIATPKEGGGNRLDRLEVNGSFLRIYQRQANGEWRMTRDMFNSSTPLTATLDTGP